MMRAGSEERDEAFDAVVRDSLPGLLAFARRLVASPDDAADTVSDALTAAWRRRDALPQEPSAARAWLFGMIRKCASNTRRSSDRRSALVVRLAAGLREDEAAAPGTDAAGPEALLREALASLKADDRHLVTLVAWDGLTVAEAGTVLGLKPSTARSRYMRARRCLVEFLETASLHSPAR